VPSGDYTVQAGDTLLSIAHAHKVSMASIMLLNDMGDSQVVKLGQVLKVPSGTSWPGENVFWIIYIVQPGEALSTVASKYGVSVNDLARINQIADQGAIAIGQKLIVPLNGLAPFPLVPSATVQG
jgi:LysM repeat protein